MKITLDQTEFSEIAEDYVANLGLALEGKKVTVEFEGTSKNFSANILIKNENSSEESKPKQRRTSRKKREEASDTSKDVTSSTKKVGSEPDLFNKATEPKEDIQPLADEVPIGDSSDKSTQESSEVEPLEEVDDIFG